MKPRRRVLLLSVTALALVAALGLALMASGRRPLERRTGSSPDTSLLAPNITPNRPANIQQWVYAEDFPVRLALFETVFWEPEDTRQVRGWLRGSSFLHGKSVLEIGTGSGLLSLCCLRAGAARVVATDINPAAVENARYNARLLGWSDRLEVRLVPPGKPGAFEVIGGSERFDLVISNPPWESRQPNAIAECALYDANFELLRTLMQGLRDYLTPGGRAWLVYGCREALHAVHAQAAEHQLVVRVLDDRDIDSLDDVFLPGVWLEVTPKSG